MSNERMVSFTAELALAVKEGRKTQTRRPIKGVDNRNHIRLSGGFTMISLQGCASTIDYVGGFRNLWESCYPGSWDRNDWVWCYEFEEMQ